MHDDYSTHDDRLINSSLVPYAYPLYCDQYTPVQSPASPQADKSGGACAVHSSVIVRRTDTTQTQTAQWSSNSCCEAPPVLVGGYGSEDGAGQQYVMVNGVAAAGYTSVIVSMSNDV